MTFKILLAILVLSAPAFAAEPTEPVREVMAVTENNWAEGASDYEPLFSDKRLSRLFSADFQTLYAEAMETPYAAEAGSPFDYDVVTNAQDGCPLENVMISPPTRDGAATHVTVEFQSFACMGEADEYQIFSTARFTLVEEDGVARIDDILATNPDGIAISAKEQLRAVIDTEE